MRWVTKPENLSEDSAGTARNLTRSDNHCDITIALFFFFFFFWHRVCKSEQMNNRDSPRAIDYPHHGVDHIAHIMSMDGHRSYKIHSNPFYLDRELHCVPAIYSWALYRNPGRTSSYPLPLKGLPRVPKGDEMLTAWFLVVDPQPRANKGSF